MPALLCVCNYPANTGYAWDFIEGLYAGVAERLRRQSLRTFVAYPAIEQPPRTLAGSAAEAIELDATLRSPRSVADTMAFVRRHDVKVVYLTDQPSRSTAYRRLRRCGVRRIVVHDHTSGERSIPTGPRRLVKWLLARTPGMIADDIITVSDYVARRQVETGLMPPDRVMRVWNGIPLPPTAGHREPVLHELLGVDPARPIVACACRAAPEKGVLHLLRAFDLLAARRHGRGPAPVLVYIGDGPQFPEIRALRETLAHRDSIFLTGYRRDAAILLQDAALSVVPSVWQDALPLAVLQAMGMGQPVVASRVGGIPEMLLEGECGLLVPPRDEPALAGAIERLLDDPALAARLGAAGRQRVASHFTVEGQLDALTAVVLRGFTPLPA